MAKERQEKKSIKGQKGFKKVNTTTLEGGVLDQGEALVIAAKK